MTTHQNSDQVGTYRPVVFAIFAGGAVDQMKLLFNNQ